MMRTGGGYRSAQPLVSRFNMAESASETFPADALYPLGTSVHQDPS